MSDPLNPNYKPGVGRLVTDRFAFQRHVEGQELRHTAPGIDLFPTVVITDGYITNIANTVQEAIDLLAVALNPPVIQDATTFNKGIIQLTGDLSGAATNVRVVALRGYPINTSAPVTNDVLTWNGTNWGPAPNPNPFTASGDLAGSNISQQVINISGNGAFVTMTCNELLIEDVVTSPVITQRGISGVNGQNLSIEAQSVTGTNLNGGNVIITGGRGTGDSSSLNGGISLRIGTNTPSNMFQAVDFNASFVHRRITALNTNTALTTTNMPVNSGDLVTFIGNAAATPAVPPVGGSILYSSAGQMHVRQTDNTDIIIGQTPNPDTWGSVIRGDQFNASGQVFRNRNIVTTIGNGPTTSMQFVVPLYTTVYVEAVVMGKKDGYLEALHYRMSAGYVREAGSTSKMLMIDTFYFDAADGDGVKYAEHGKATFLALGWSQPTITLTGNVINIITGDTNLPGINTTWFTVGTFYTCPSYTNP